MKTITITISDQNITKLKNIGLKENDYSLAINHCIENNLKFEEITGKSINEYFKKHHENIL